MNANTIYIQLTINQQVSTTSSLKSQKREHITFGEQRKHNRFLAIAAR
jgi:hypothetical protein